MGKRDRVRLAAGMLLSVSAVCTVLLTLCAGGNAAAVFAAREAAVQQTASPAPQGPLAGLVIAVDAGHGGYDGGAVTIREAEQEKRFEKNEVAMVRLHVDF